MGFDANRADLCIGVIGTGAMGRGIVQVAAAGGMHVLMMDTRAGAADEDKEVCICCGLGCVSAGSEGGQVRVSCESRR